MIRQSDKMRLFILAAAVVAVGLALLGLFGSTSGFMQRFVATVAVPFHSIGSYLAGTFDDGDCSGSEEMLSRIETLETENSGLKSLASENEYLKSALGFSENSGDDSVTARVVYESDDGSTRMLVINKGSADGLEVGMPVVVGDGVIIGKVSVLRQKTSSVMPLTDSRSRLAVTVQNSQETLGVLEGDRGLSLSLNLVPQTEDLTVGDTVITSGLERGIRRGLVVGTIDRVNRPPREPFQSAAVAQFVTWRHPLFVLVIMGHREEGGESQ